MSALLFALLGLIIGSFLNVLVLRHGVRGMGGRSGCLSCRRMIRWYDNVPVISYFLLRGRCRACGSAISLQYPLVELTTALVFASIIAGTPLSALADMQTLVRIVVICALSALLLAIAVYDLRHTIIPDQWVYLFDAAALVYALLFALDSSYSTMVLLLAGPLTALPLFLLWFVSRGRWMGLGDAKLALGIGWLLGPLLGFQAIMYAFVLGAIVGLAILLPLPLYRHALSKAGIARTVASRSYTMKSEVPFGPFLIASCLIVWLMQLHGMPVPLAIV